MAGRKYKGRAEKPTDAEAGAAAVRKFMIGLYDREDGRAANWPLIAETLFRAAFEALGEVPDNHPGTDPLLRRVHDGAYNRLVKNEGTEAMAVAEGLAETSPDRPRSLRRSFTP
jgi:hypothetical protein